MLLHDKNYFLGTNEETTFFNYRIAKTGLWVVEVKPRSYGPGLVDAARMTITCEVIRKWSIYWHNSVVRDDT